ncbi:MAG: DUF5675 family protein [Bacteroidales bacterium]
MNSVNRILLLLLVAGLVFLLILFVSKPELLDTIWLWLVGLAGAIVKSFQSLIEYFKKKFGQKEEPANEASPNGSGQQNRGDAQKEVVTKPFNGTTLNLLRYSDNGNTTVGLLNVNGQFYCYTLEDTYHEEKIPGETRIPAGIYTIQFKKELTELTKKYREKYSEWFTWHLELQNVPEYNSIYIHNGGDHTHTEGCILVSDSLSITDASTTLTNSRMTFQFLYKFLKEKLDNNVPLRIVIKDEHWIKELK